MQDANIQAIKTSFRRLSLELHPDKNPAENADEQFRNLVAIYEVLKDSKKRKYYDEVLINGLPNWRSAVYYYRHVRRIGLLELCLFLFILLSIGQYLVGWASYLERKYTLVGKIFILYDFNQIRYLLIGTSKRKETKENSSNDRNSKTISLQYSANTNPMPLMDCRYIITMGNQFTQGEGYGKIRRRTSRK